MARTSARSTTPAARASTPPTRPRRRSTCKASTPARAARRRLAAKASSPTAQVNNLAPVPARQQRRCGRLPLSRDRVRQGDGAARLARQRRHADRLAQRPEDRSPRTCTAAAAPDQNRAVLKLKAGQEPAAAEDLPGRRRLGLLLQGRAGAAAGRHLGVRGRFRRRSASAPTGIGSDVKGDTLTVCDVNGDGRPDFLYGAGTRPARAEHAGKGFVEAKDSRHRLHSRARSARSSATSTTTATPTCSCRRTDGCKLFRNDGKGHFTDVTAKAGDLAKFTGHATCAAWGDVDNDGHLDLVVGCLRGPNRFFRNKGDGTFEDATEALGLTSRSSTRRRSAWSTSTTTACSTWSSTTRARSRACCWATRSAPAKRTPVTLQRRRQGRRHRQPGAVCCDKDGKLHGVAQRLRRRRPRRPGVAGGPLRPDAGHLPRRGAATAPASSGTKEITVATSACPRRHRRDIAPYRARVTFSFSREPLASATCALARGSRLNGSPHPGHAMKHSALLVGVLLVIPASASAYIGGPPASLGMMCDWSTHAIVVAGRAGRSAQGRHRLPQGAGPQGQMARRRDPAHHPGRPPGASLTCWSGPRSARRR